MLAGWLLERHEPSVKRDAGGRGDELRAKAPCSVSDNLFAREGMPAPRIRRAS
jgi:hypothetical protein